MDVPTLTGRQRILIGGLGAMSPVLLNLAVHDAKTVFGDPTLIAVAMYAVKVLALFAVGALAVWLRPNESDAKRLFEIGIVAPALITGAINGADVERHGAPRGDPITTASIVDGLFIGVAYAQPGTPVVYSFSRPPAESPASQAVRGLLGWSGGGRWFVVLSASYATPADAFNAAARVRATSGRSSRVYGPGGPSNAYVVVLGDWLEENAAVQLTRTLRASGLDVYTWSVSASKRSQ
jgi:hypothetical protein